MNGKLVKHPTWLQKSQYHGQQQAELSDWTSLKKFDVVQIMSHGAQFGKEINSQVS